MDEISDHLNYVIHGNDQIHWNINATEIGGGALESGSSGGHFGYEKVGVWCVLQNHKTKNVQKSEKFG